MWRLIEVKCQQCGSVSEAMLDTNTDELSIDVPCTCAVPSNEKVISVPVIIATGNEGTAREGRGRKA